MFKSSVNNQGNLFSGITTHITSRKEKMLLDPSSWHNLFYQEVVSRIDEYIFSVLYCGDNGRPNASIRVLIGMMVLKEGNGWSDEQLFDECRFNIKVMMALGHMNLDEDVPSESTYYLFRRLLDDYNRLKGTDLLKQCFEKITTDQLRSYNVSGKKIRLDSKLINSDIAVCSRVDLILESIRKFVKHLAIGELKEKIEQEDYELLLKLKKKSTTNITFGLTKADKQLLLHRMGFVIKALLNCCKHKPRYDLLKRLYEDQYTEVNKPDQNGDDNDDTGTPELKDEKEILSTSMQSIHDPEATFRTKGHGTKKQQISGYHANITETCDESNEFNLIVDAQVDKAHISENDFLLDSIVTSKEVMQNAGNDHKGGAKVIEQVTTDGGYDSIENRKEMSKQDMPHWNLSKAKGVKQSFIMYKDDDNNLQAIDKRTGVQCEISRSKKDDKVVIIIPATKDRKIKRRYFKDEKIENYIVLQNILNGIKPEDRNLRANVESTIHQSFHRLLKRNKVRYRGQHRCQMYVISRVLWANFRRIQAKVGQDFAYLMIWMLSMIITPHTTKRQNRVIY